MSFYERLERIDRRQQESRRIGFVAAVVKKFGDDQAGQLAALISYYAFVSIFPLMLVFVTVIGFLLKATPRNAKNCSTARSASFRSSATSSSSIRSTAAPRRSRSGSCSR